MEEPTLPGPIKNEYWTMYEALIHDIRVVDALGERRLFVCGNSELVIN